MEKLIFLYPSEEENIAETFEKIKKIRSKKQKKSVIFLLFSGVFLIISSAFHVTILDYFALAGLALFIISLYELRFLLASKLVIRAYENHIEFEYYSFTKQPLIKVSAMYKEIQQAYLMNKYKEVVIIFNNDDCIAYCDSKGNIKKSNQKIVRFQLNSKTPEQGFFLYTAPKLFNVKFNKKKMLGKFGDEDDYYNNI